MLIKIYFFFVFLLVIQPVYSMEESRSTRELSLDPAPFSSVKHARNISHQEFEIFEKCLHICAESKLSLGGKPHKEERDKAFFDHIKKLSTDIKRQYIEVIRKFHIQPLQNGASVVEKILYMEMKKNTVN